MRKLSEFFEKHHGNKVVVLIDEYDVPLNQAFKAGYYGEFVNIYSSLLGSVLKSNKSLAFAVVTGCLKISKGSIFTGLNNLAVYDVTKLGMNEFFGLNNEEVSKMLNDFGLSSYHEDARKFYDGYRFGSWLMYNPYAITNFIEEAIKSIADHQSVMFPREWIKSSSNDILKRLLDISAHDPDVALSIESLGKGESIVKKLIDELTFDAMYDESDALWTVMMHTGYLTCERLEAGGVAWLRVPNEEVLGKFEDMLLDISRRSIGNVLYPCEYCEAM